MAQLPEEFGDLNEWGGKLNSFLRISHNEDGTLNAVNAISVKGTGAVGDGSTDDHDAIQAALDTAHVLGGAVYMPPGHYLISAGLTLYANVDVYGAGPAATYLECSDAINAAMTLEQAGDFPIRVKVSNFRVTGPGSGATAGIKVGSTTNGAPAYGFEMERMYFENFYIGAHLHGLFMTRVIHCDFWDNVSDGLWLDGGTVVPVAGTYQTSISVQTCYSNGNGGKGFHLNKITYATLLDCAADNNAEAYYGYDLRDVAFISCGAESPDDPARQMTVGTQPIGFHITGEATIGTSNVSMTTCYAYAITDKPFWFENYVLNSSMTNCSQLTPAGIAPLPANHGLIIGATCTMSEFNCAFPDGETISPGAKNFMAAPAKANGDPAGISFSSTSPSMFPYTDSIQFFAKANGDVPIAILGTAGQVGAFLYAHKVTSVPGDGGPAITLQPYGQGQVAFGTDQTSLIERPPGVDFLSTNVPWRVPTAASVSALNTNYPASSHSGCHMNVVTDKGIRVVVSDGTQWVTMFMPPSGYAQPVTQAQTDGY